MHEAAFELQNGTVRLNRALKGLCSNLEQVESRLQSLGAVAQARGERQTDYIFRLPSEGSGEVTRRIKFRLKNGEPFGVYLYDRAHTEPDAKFDFLRPADLTLVEALQRSGVPYVVVTKTRTRYVLGDLLIHLDQVQGLGDVVEVEGLNGTPVTAQVWEAIAPYWIRQLEGSNEDYFQP